jgi:thiamine biosynthesis lipoprotein
LTKFYSLIYMKRAFTLLILTLLVFSANAQVLRKRTVKLMGGRWQITLVGEDSISTEQNIDTVIAEIARIENLISDWKPASQVSIVNSNAGILPVKVDQEVFDLTERALSLSKITKGAFDISFAAMDRIWKFDGTMTQMPTPAAIKRSVQKIGYKNIILDRNNCTIFLKIRGMKIGFGALGEGYAADKSRQLMLKKGIKAGIINGTGDMSAWGKQPDGSDWTVGITNPLQEDTIINIMPLTAGAVVTSGSYEKFVIFHGKRYSHIINPVTGYPATGLSSVTIFGPSAERANGFSTSMMVLGKSAAIRFINQFPDYNYILITDHGQILSSPVLNFKKDRLK